MALTSYNGYDCAKDRRHLFTPEELEAMHEADAVIEREFQLESEAYLARLDTKRKQYAAWVLRNKEKKREYMRQYMDKKRAGIPTARVKKTPEELAATRHAWYERNKEWIRQRNRMRYHSDMHDEILVRQRASKERAKAQQGGQTA